MGTLRFHQGHVGTLESSAPTPYCSLGPKELGIIWPFLELWLCDQRAQAGLRMRCWEIY